MKAGPGAPVQKPVSKAHKLFATGVISKTELDSLLRADARFRFEETIAPPMPKDVSAVTGSRPWPPPPPPPRSAAPSLSPQALQAHRDAARRRGREEKAARDRNREREFQIAADSITWVKILDEWDERRGEKSYHQLEPLCARGIPPALRRRAWSALIGNPLQITRELYEITAERARATFASQQEQAAADEKSGGGADLGDSGPIGGKLPAARGNKEGSIRLIEQDLPRTFPGELAAVRGESDTLREVLQTFVCFRPDIGYVQGMSYLAAALLLYFDDGYDCFRCFANTLNSHFFFDFYRLQREKLDVHLKAFEYYFESRLPVLWARFQQFGVAPDMYYLEWSLTLFVKFLPLNICARIWDAYLLAGESYFIRAALGLLRFHAEVLGAMEEFEEVIYFLQRLPQDMDEAALFASIDEISITPASCERAIRRIEDPSSRSAEGLGGCSVC